MQSLYFLIPTIVTIFISTLIVRAGAIALMMTGMPLGKAKFQSLSAFTGTGFTTREAESVVNHPLRRTIVSWLMILGNVGIVTVIITATSSFVQSQAVELPLHIVFLGLGVLAIFQVAKFTGLSRLWERLVEARLAKSDLFEEAPADELLHVAEGYGLVQFGVAEGSALDGESLADSGIDQKHIIALGIERGGEWMPALPADTVLHRGDKLVVYGRLRDLREFGRTEAAARP